MATDAIHPDRIGKLFSVLEARKSRLATCTDLYKEISNHFHTLQQSLHRRSEDLDSEIQSFESRTKKTLESLVERENSIPERESAAAARVEELRQSAISDFANPVAQDAEFTDVLKSCCRKMDVTGLVRCLLSNRKESGLLRSEIRVAVEEAVDAHILVLDGVEEFVDAKLGKKGVADRRWAWGVLMEVVFPYGELRVERRIAGSIVKRAAEVAEKWKGILRKGEGGEVGAGEAAMFLHLLAAFGLRSKFEEVFLRKLLVEHAARRDMAKIAVSLGFGDQMGDIIEELVKRGKEVEAVHFAFESGLTDQFQPASLLKSHLNNCKRNVNDTPKGGDPAAAMERELNSGKAIIKCVEDYKLKPEFSLDSLKKRVAQLEKSKAEKKKTSGPTNRPPNKRNRDRERGATSFRPSSKAGRFSNLALSFSHNSLPQTHQAAAPRYSLPYSYAAQGGYESGSGVQYGAGYGAARAQSPSGLAQQYSSYGSQDLEGGSFRSGGGSYGGHQPGYGAYDYSTTAAAYSNPQAHASGYPQSYPQ